MYYCCVVLISWCSLIWAYMLMSNKTSELINTLLYNDHLFLIHFYIEIYNVRYKYTTLAIKVYYLPVWLTYRHLLWACVFHECSSNSLRSRRLGSVLLFIQLLSHLMCDLRPLIFNKIIKINYCNATFLGVHGFV